LKGFHAGVLRWDLGDCTNNGYSKDHSTIFIASEGNPDLEVLDLEEGEIPFKLVTFTIDGKEYKHLEPLDKQENGTWQEETLLIVVIVDLGKISMLIQFRYMTEQKISKNLSINKGIFPYFFLPNKLFLVYKLNIIN
jgi:hypothetical protein